MNNCKKTNVAVITPVLAAGSVASPYYVQAKITKKLCKRVCVNEIPVFAPVFSVLSASNVGTGQYVVTIHVEGSVTYNPCHGCCCAAEVEIISQNFTIPISSATDPTSVTIEAGASVNSIVADGCETCSANFKSETPLTITVA
jgi:hypothetical protein